MTQAALLALLLSAAAPLTTYADVQGFTQQDLERAATGARTEAEDELRAARAIQAQTETLRAAFVLNPDAAMNTLSASERSILSHAFGPDDGRMSARAEWFARGAEVRAAPDGGFGAAGMYNPILDAWLIVRWDVLGGAIRLTDAAMVDGAVMRPASDAALWIDAGAGDPAALAAQRDAAFVQFDEAFSADGADAIFFALHDPSLSRRGEVWTRADRWLAGLAVWGGSAERVARLQRVHEALIAGPESDLGRRLRLPPALDALPPRLRATMAPIATWSTPDGERLLLLSPLSARHGVLMSVPSAGGANFEAIILTNPDSSGVRP